MPNFIVILWDYLFFDNYLLFIRLSWGLCLILPWGLRLTSFRQNVSRPPLSF